MSGTWVTFVAAHPGSIPALRNYHAAEWIAACRLQDEDARAASPRIVIQRLRP